MGHERGSQWRKFCPAQKKTCRKCGKLGHFEVVCRSQPLKKKVEKSKRPKAKGKTNTVNEESSSSEGESTNAIDEGLGFIFELAERKAEKSVDKGSQKWRLFARHPFRIWWGKQASGQLEQARRLPWSRFLTN